jgi:hypothetical protein
MITRSISVIQSAIQKTEMVSEIIEESKAGTMEATHCRFLVRRLKTKDPVACHFL